MTQGIHAFVDDADDVSHTLRTPQWAVNNVQIFRTGNFRGKNYSRGDLDRIVENFNRFGPGGAKDLSNPVVLGHEETQEFLERTDLPAAGWIRDLGRGGTRPDKPQWADPDILYADFRNVPPQVARLIANRNYAHVSSEIYDNYKGNDGQGRGRALRRVAILGGEIPQVKGLEELPMPEHQEYTERRAPSLRASNCYHNDTTFICLSEVVPMDVNAINDTPPNAVATMPDRNSMATQMAEWMPEHQEKFEAMPDQKLGEMYAECMKHRERMSKMAEGDNMDGDEGGGVDTTMGDGDADNMDENANMNGMETPASTTTDADAERNGLISALVQQGWHAEDLQDKSDEELKTLLNENNTGTDSSPAGTAKMSEKAIAQLKADLRKEIKAEVKKELQADMARLGAQNDQAGRMQLQRFAEEKRATIDSFCERMVRDGKILPANLARVKSRLYRADAINKVVLFSEGGKQTKITELADQMKEIEAGPVVMKFGEKVKTHAGKPVEAGDDHDEEVVKFSELIEEKNQQFGGELFTPKEIKDSIEAFKKVRKANPKVTAESAL